MLGDELAERRGEHGEGLADLRGAHPRLVVLEEHVVRVVVRREALDVLAPEVDDALERRAKRCEVGLLARFHPHLVRLGGRCRKLHCKRGRHPARAVPVTLCEPHERGVVRVVGKRGGVRLELLEQLAEALVDDVRMDDLLERAELRRSCRGTAGRHEDLHVPDEDRLGATEVRELAEAFLELGESLLHGG